MDKKREALPGGFFFKHQETVDASYCLVRDGGEGYLDISKLGKKIGIFSVQHHNV